jgi:hypothetical protein
MTDTHTRELIEELLDAHEDTVHMLLAGATLEHWRAHVDYLRSLQRVGHEVLAASDLGERSALRRKGSTSAAAGFRSG